MQTKKENITGLSQQEVQERRKKGLVNGNFSIKTKSIPQIIYSNTCTLFHFVNIILAVCLALVHSYKNMLFLGVVFWNVFIGIFQEIRSKRIVDRLSLLSEPLVNVLREGIYSKLKVEDVVIDDVFSLSHGNQVCLDAVILWGECEVNESLLTGESESVFKKAGDEILSGSFVISGEVLAQVVHIGKDNYVNRITSNAKYLKKPNSEMLSSIKAIIKFVSIVLIPVAFLLFVQQLQIEGTTKEDAIVSTVAAVIGMIPSGLVLLISVVLAVSVVRLGKKNTLVQELYCIETLARVDTLCLDKTGTITEGVMDVDGVEILSDKFTKEQIDEIIYFFTNGLNDTNPTFCALKEYSEKLYAEKKENRKRRIEDYKVIKKIGFSSDKKWSLVDFEKRGTYVIGALDFVMKEKEERLKQKESHFAKDGVRVLVLAHTEEHCIGRDLPKGLEAYAFILLTDRIRHNAAKTIKYFRNQGVDIKIISGDNPQTVSNIAKRIELPGAENYLDATKITTEEEMKEAIEQYTVFGRVTPAQKLKLVQTLKEHGHIVAMTGDGVNDVMALKEADCSIAMQSGSDAARNVSQIVLMDSDFASMPSIVAEGRRTIHNIQRSAALYLTKTIYATVLAVIFVFFSAIYPFWPIQLTLVGTLGIGIPSFLLAMEPNEDKVKGKFLYQILKLAIPGGCMVVTNVMLVEVIGYFRNLHPEEISTLAFFGLAVAMFVQLITVCKPWNLWRIMMCGVIFFIFSISVMLFRRFFEVATLSFEAKVVLAVMIGITPAVYALYRQIVRKMSHRLEKT